MNKTLLTNVIELIKAKKYTIALSESCTGGAVSSYFTSFPGASKFFKGGFVTYSDESKIKFLDITKRDIKKYGVVSQYIAELMAVNTRKKYNTDFGLSSTGYLDLGDRELAQGASLNAWICVSSVNALVSQHIVLNKNRALNIQKVSNALVELFRKEIV